MALSLTKTQLIELLPQCITITSEVGRVSGPGYRERYLTPGRFEKSAQPITIDEFEKGVINA